jgi:hypothetical protein
MCSPADALGPPSPSLSLPPADSQGPPVSSSSYLQPPFFGHGHTASTPAPHTLPFPLHRAHHQRVPAHSPHRPLLFCDRRLIELH